MRILRLVAEGEFAVEFHPFITVATDLDDDRRDRIVEAFGQAATGRSTSLHGLIEVHGVVLDLDQQALELLELEDSEVRTSVLVDDLPGNATSGVGRQVRAAERRLEELEQPHRDRLLELQEAEEALASALAAEAAAEAPTADPVAAPVDEEARIALVERRAQLQSERDRLFASLDPAADAALDDARSELAAAEAALEEARSAAEPDSTSATSELDSVDLPDLADEAALDDDVGADDGPALSDADRNEQLDELRTSLSLHRLYDAAPVREALDDLRAAHRSGEQVQSTEALSLADRISELDRRIAELSCEHGEEPSAAAVAAAGEQVERARVSLADKERAAAAEPAGDDDIAKLEEAHTEVERARDALDGRFGKAKAQRRLDDALAAEDELLERLGLHSYADFLTRGGSASVGPSTAGAELDAARAELASAESELEALQSTVDAALAEAELVEERRRARDEARTLLGNPDLPDESILSELIDVRVPADPAGPLGQLVDVLDAVGLPVGGLDLGETEVEAMAADWLAEYQHAEARLLERIDELESPDRPLLDVSAPSIDEPDPAPVAETANWDVALDEASRRVDDTVVADEIARQRAAAHESAVEALSQAETALAEVEAELAELDAAPAPSVPPTEATPENRDELRGDASARVAAAREAVDTASEGFDHAKAEYDAAVQELAALRQMVSEMEVDPAPVEEIEWYLLARLAAQRQQSFVGSLPLVIAGALDGVSDDEGLVHLLDRLERMAGAVQIVHLTDDPRIVAWADGLDDDRAAVVRPAAPKVAAG